MRQFFTLLPFLFLSRVSVGQALTGTIPKPVSLPYPEGSFWIVGKTSIPFNITSPSGQTAAGLKIPIRDINEYTNGNVNSLNIS